MTDDKIIKRFEKDHKLMDNFWAPLHKKHKNQIKFIWFNDQWDSTAREERGKSSSNGQPLPPRPTLVFNLVKAFVIKVTNSIKKMKPALKVAGIDGESDKVLADVRRGIIQSIERNTGAIPARLNAMVDAVSAGYGFYRFVTDYADPMSYEQEFKYKTIEDATTVLFDEGSIELDGSDCKKAMVQEKYTKRNFKAEFGIDWDEVYQAGGTEWSTAWGTADSPSVSEYWYIEEKKERLVKLTPEFGNKNQYYSKVVEMAEELNLNPDYMLQIGEDGKIIERPTTSRQVMWCKLAGKKVLDKRMWPGYWIPIFKVSGRVKKSQEEVIMSGLGDDANAPQKAYNYARNNQLERLALTPKAPYLTPMGSIPVSEKYKWNTANTRNWTNLNYNATDEQGNPLPPPQRANTVQVDPGLAVEAQTSASEIKSTMGLYGSYVGDTESEKSGRAILAGAEESADTVYDFANNLGETMSHECRVVNEMVPKIHSTAKQIRMMGEDDQEKVVWINQKAQDEKGEEYYYDMNQGKFDLSYSMGPSDATKRADTRDDMEAFLSKLPPEFTAGMSDLLAIEQDTRNAEKMAERAKAMIDMQWPGLIKEDEDDEDNEPPPELIEAQQVIDQMQAQLQEMSMENESMKNDKRLEAMKIQIEDFKAKTDRLKAIADAENEKAKLEVEADKADADAIQREDQMLIDAEKNELQEYIDGLIEQMSDQMEALQDNIKESSEKPVEKPEPVKPPEPQPINVTVNMPKNGEKKSVITLPSGKTATVETKGEDSDEGTKD